MARPAISNAYLAGLLVFVIFLMPAPALASPWGQDRGAGLFISNLDYYTSDQKSGGRFEQFSSATYAEAGLGAGLTLGANIIYARQYSNAPADPFAAEGFSAADFYIQKSFPQTDGSVFSLKGTYHSKSSLQRFGVAGERSKARRDAAFTMGAGWGRSFGAQARTFMTVEPAFRTSLGEDADSAVLDATLGRKLGDRWMLLGKSLNEVAVSNPGTGGLDYDTARIELSAVYSLTKNYSLEVGTSREIAGRNITPGTAFHIGLWGRY